MSKSGLSLKSLFANAGYVFAGNSGGTVLAFFQGIIVARALGPARFGIWGCIVSYTALVSLFLKFRTEEPLTKHIVDSRTRDDREDLRLLINTAYYTDAFISLASVLIIAAAAPIAAGFVKGGSQYLVAYRIYPLVLLFQTLDSLWYCILRDLKRFRLLSSLPLLFTAVKLSLSAVAWYANLLDLSVLAEILVVTAVFEFGVKAFLLRRILHAEYGISLLDLSPAKCFRLRAKLADFWSFMRVGYVSSQLSTLVKNGDMLVLGYFTSPTEVGLYRLAKNLVSVIQSVGNSLTSVVYQDLNELTAAKNRAGLANTLSRLLRFWSPLVIVGALIGMVIAEPLIARVYGAAYVPAIHPLRIFLIGTGVILSLFWVQPLVLATGRFRLYLYSTVIYTATGLVSLCILSKLWGASGAAAAFTFTTVLVHLVQLSGLIGELREKRPALATDALPVQRLN